MLTVPDRTGAGRGWRREHPDAGAPPLRVRVDPVACDAYGYCAELLPERVTLDEWGYPVVDGTPVGADLVDLATPGRRRVPAAGDPPGAGGRPTADAARPRPPAQVQTVPGGGSTPPSRYREHVGPDARCRTNR